MNIDYELVGFYQSHLFGACYTQEMIESLIEYQETLFDGVVLIYGETEPDRQLMFPLLQTRSAPGKVG